MTGPSSLNFNFWKNDILWYCMLHATCKGIVTNWPIGDNAYAHRLNVEEKGAVELEGKMLVI